MKPLEKTVTRAELEAHAQSLGLSDIDTVDEAQVKAAYRKLLFDKHPDTGDGALSVLSLRYAKDTLLAWIAGRPQLGCAVCGGTGYVSAGGFRIQPCYRCGA